MSTDKKTIDWYNQNARNYADHTKTDKGSFHFGLEKPAMYAELPDLGGKIVLSLGCGAGHDSAELKKRGAAHSVGIDISEELIKIAKAEHPECEFHVMDMEKLVFSDSEFDFIYSSLAVHYLKDWGNMLAEAYRVLKPGGIFLFSCGHPVTDQWDVHMEGNIRVKQLRVEENKQNDEVKIFGEYLDQAEAHGGGHMEGVIAYHRPLQKVFDDVLAAGFRLKRFVEPKSTEEMKRVNIRDYLIHQKFPFIFICKLEKPIK